MIHICGRTCDLEVLGLIPSWASLCKKNLVQVIYTDVPLSPHTRQYNLILA